MADGSKVCHRACLLLLSPVSASGEELGLDCACAPAPVACASVDCACRSMAPSLFLCTTCRWKVRSMRASCATISCTVRRRATVGGEGGDSLLDALSPMRGGCRESRPCHAAVAGINAVWRAVASNDGTDGSCVWSGTRSMDEQPTGAKGVWMPAPPPPLACAARNRESVETRSSRDTGLDPQLVCARAGKHVGGKCGRLKVHSTLHPAHTVESPSWRARVGEGVEDAAAVCGLLLLLSPSSAAAFFSSCACTCTIRWLL